MGEGIPEFLSTDWILAQFASNKKRARDLYADFVYRGQGKKDNPLAELKGQAIFGGDGFVEKVKSYLDPSELSAEIPKNKD